jgi:ABC-type dipeptide/oligopeptide/nickel transport system ATPase component
VGESGSGKSVTSLAAMGLLPRPSGRIAAGAIRFRRRDGALIDLAHGLRQRCAPLRGARSR